MRIHFRQISSAFKQNSAIYLGVIAGLTSVLSVAVATHTLANPSIEVAPASISSEPLMAQSQQTIDFTGSFIAAEAPTTGTARIVTEAGHRYLEIDSAFSTTNQAPDLHVLLETAGVPPSSYSTFGSYINLGKLQNTTGAQRYPIPDAVDIAQFKSVVIWCRMANATMGYATLGEASNASVQ
jgi:hypothetical protein